MDLQSFAIGIVTMVVFALAIVTIIGILKVTKMAAELLKLKRRLEDDERELSRDINMVDQTLQNQIEQRIDNVYHAIENVGKTQAAYTDRRIDKLIDTYFDIENAKKIKKTILKD